MYTRLTSVHVDEDPSLWSNDPGLHGVHAVDNEPPPYVYRYIAYLCVHIYIYIYICIDIAYICTQDSHLCT